MLVLVSSLAFASAHDENMANASEKMMDDEVVKQPREVPVEVTTGQVDRDDMGTDSPAGLGMALDKVSNEQARMRLQANLERFEANYQARLERMEDVEVEVDEESGELEVKGKEPVKYLGFINGKATQRFNINAEGQISERAPWYRFLYAEQDLE